MGLLDFMNTQEGRLGLGLLALGQAPRSQAMPGLLSLMANENAMKQHDMQRQLMQSQIDENRVQNQQREMQMKNAMEQQARENAFFGFGGTPTASQGFAGSATAGIPSASVGGASAMPSEGKFDEWSKQYGIPKDALIIDYIKNGGKGIAEMIAKRGTPDMQVTNGYAYDKNRLGAGYLPQLNISNDGKATQVQIGADGLPVVSAPRGAAETFGTYQGIQAGIQSANTPIKVFNPQTQREEFMRQSSVLQGQGAAPTNYTGAGYNNGSASGAAAEQLLYMQAELNKMAPDDPNRAVVAREMARLGGQPAQSGNFAAGPSAQELAANDAARTRAVDTAKADVVRDTEGRTKVRNANENLTNADRAIELLKLGPTGSAIGALVDKGAAVVGKATSGGNIAAQLDIVSANMVKNVPRFEGPQSNIDVEGYKSAAGRVADRSLPIEQRIAAANEVKYFEQKALRQAQGGQGGGDQQNQPKQRREFSMLPKATEYDGKRMRAPDGTIYRSTGGQWRKE